MKQRTRIMYIEYKGDNGIVGDARIGRVTIINDGKSLRYQEKRFSSLRGRGFKSNYYDVQTREYYWISGCRRDGRDALYSNTVEIDEDVCEEYWAEIRKMPEKKNVKVFRCEGKYSR
ncbi:MAG TPA: hypothetical protein VK400_18740 [Pyrinomonadaceae bacterium]|nr:hypothetical protein [Pyrinomonadaceae bacterium]